MKGDVSMGKEAVYKDMRTSMKRVEILKPIIKRLLKGGNIFPVEGDDNDICKLLDTTCGTDYLQVYEEKGLAQGVASRIQTIKTGYKPYNSFTIRKDRQSGASTEFEKRRYAIGHGGIYPYLTMQAYFDEEDRPLSVAFAKTSDLMDYIEKYQPDDKHTGADQIGQSSFYVCKWDDMKAKKYPVVIWQLENSEVLI